MTTSFTTKQPYEAFPVSFDFTTDLGAETIASATITAVDMETLTDVSTTVLDATQQTNDDHVVYGYVQGGTNGHNYLLTCRIVGSLGAQYELEAVQPVAETPVTTEETGRGETLASLTSAIEEILQDSTYTPTILQDRINEAILTIAGGVRMPDGLTSPPLPDLYKIGAVATTTVAYASLPTDYQRGLFSIADSSGNKIAPPNGGDYYSFQLFIKQIRNLNMTETGSVYRVCVKGRKLYYQGIPSASEILGVHYYRKPVAMALDSDEPDGIPDQFQMRLIKHYVCKEIFGEAIEDGQDSTAHGMKYHTGKFFEAMTDLIDFIGIDATPQYYGSDESEDYGACD